MAQNKTPLSDSVYLIMLSLITPMHGYAIMQHVEEISCGETSIGPATLYTSLTKLQENGWIVPCEPLEQKDERRKPYILTDKGKTVLQVEVARRQKMAQLGIDIMQKIGEKFNDNEAK